MNELNERLKKITSKRNYELKPKISDANLLIEVTNKCNCNCIFCANSKMKRTKKEINEKFIMNILKESFELGVKEVGFYTTGESLLNEKLVKYIECAKKIGYNYIYLTTNGILLNDKKIKELVAAGIDSIKLSINAINKEDYEFIHGVDLFEQVLNNLKELYNYKKNNNLLLKVFVSYIATRYTDYNINDIKASFLPYCDEVAIINVRNQSGMMGEINNLLSCVKEENKIDAQRLVPCHYVFNTINVTSEGYLTACCSDFENYLAYANLNKTTLKEAWHNDLITELRQKHLENNLDKTLCNNCIYGVLDIPKPLDKNLIEIDNFNHVFNDDKVRNRLKMYKKNDIL